MSTEPPTARFADEPDAAELTKSAARGVVWSVFQSVASRVTTAAVFVILARLLDPRAFGLVALASVVIAIVTVLSDQGLGQALVQRPELEREHIDTVFWISMAMSLVLTGALIASAAPLAHLFHKDELAPVVRWLSLASPCAAIGSVPQAMLQRRLQFRVMAQRRVLSNVLGGAAGIIAAFAGFGVWSLVIQTVAQAAAGSAVVWTQAPWVPHLKVSRRHFRELFSFSSNVAAMNLLNIANRRGDDALIGAVLGPAALGLYSVAYRLLLLMTDVLIWTISTVAFPVFSRAQGNRDLMVRGYFRATQLCCAVAVPCFLIVAVTAPDVTSVVFGDKWLPSVPVMRVLSILGALQAIIFFNQQVLKAVGKSSAALKITALNAVANVAAFAVTVHWGILAVALACVIRAYLFAPIPLVMSRRVLGFEWGAFVRLLGGPIASSLGMTALTLLVQGQLGDALGPMTRLAITVPLGVIVYVVLLYLWSPQVLRDVRRFAADALPAGRGRRRRLIPASEKASA